MDPSPLETLQAVLKHRPIRLSEDIEANLDDPIRRDTQDVAVVRRVVQSAESKAVRHDGLALRMFVGKDMGRLEQLFVAQATDRALLLIGT